jgi:hypothetical protein
MRFCLHQHSMIGSLSRRAALVWDEGAMRKMLNIGRATLEALELLAADRKVDLQDLVDEALDDLLKKHHRPVTTNDMFAKSLKAGHPKRKGA